MNTFFRIAVLGDALSVERLCSTISDSAIIVTHLTDIQKSLDVLKRENFDIVVVDCHYKEAYLACKSIVEISMIPIALLVKNKVINWDRIYDWNVDGFVPDESSGAELIARIKAISRRKLAATKT